MLSSAFYTQSCLHRNPLFSAAAKASDCTSPSTQRCVCVTRYIAIKPALHILCPSQSRGTPTFHLTSNCPRKMTNSDSNAVKKPRKYRWRHINKNDAPKTVQNLFKSEHFVLNGGTCVLGHDQISRAYTLEYPDFMIIGENNTKGEEWVAYGMFNDCGPYYTFTPTLFYSMR